MKRVCLAFVVLTVFILAIITPGCDSSMEGYQTFTFNKVAHFSFEYPAHYKKTSAHGTVEDNTIFIGFGDKLPSKGSTEGFIEIRVEGIGDMYPDAKVALEKEISQFVESENLMEYSTVIVAGIPAELLVYLHESPVVPEAPAGSWEVMKVFRAVYFDYNGLIWNLVIDSDEDRAEEAREDFEHLLEAFQILD